MFIATPSLGAVLNAKYVNGVQLEYGLNLFTKTMARLDHPVRLVCVA